MEVEGVASCVAQAGVGGPGCSERNSEDTLTNIQIHFRYIIRSCLPSIILQLRVIFAQANVG